MDYSDELHVGGGGRGVFPNCPRCSCGACANLELTEERRNSIASYTAGLLVSL